MTGAGRDLTKDSGAALPCRSGPSDRDHVRARRSGKASRSGGWSQSQSVAVSRSQTTTSKARRCSSLRWKSLANDGTRPGKPEEPLTSSHHDLKMMHQLVRRGFAVAGTSRHAIKAASAGAVASTSLIMPHHLPTPMSLARPVHTSPSIYAQSTTPNSSLANPAEEEAQKALDEGTSRLEAGDWEAAKEAYARR